MRPCMYGGATAGFCAFKHNAARISGPPRVMLAQTSQDDVVVGTAADADAAITRTDVGMFTVGKAQAHRIELAAKGCKI